MLSGPGMDRFETLTGDDKITLYNFLREINESRNKKITGKQPSVSGDIERRNIAETPAVRLQDPLSERSKHDHEENSLHDHWGEAEHTHTHQVRLTSHQ